MHGLAMLLVEDVLDLGADIRDRSRVDLIPARVEILLRSLIGTLEDAANER
ncbi:MAG: hypothetical protein HXY25_04080 [Alphaproteobacteria bacterium]|nr:hypothetical protein [Alphaproteobacteria bacterium]